MYRVFQIQLSDAEVDMVNNGERIARYEVKRDMFGNNVAELAKTAFSSDYYDHVANIKAYDLDSVFAIGNGMMDGEVERTHEYCSSISVGDIIINEHDEKFVVDTFGFKQID